MEVKIVNKSSRDLPDELITACKGRSFSAINDVASQYNLKVIELTITIMPNDEVTKHEIVIGDVWNDKQY